MDDVMRKAVEQRAFALWEAGRAEGSGLLYWLLAELELGVIRKVDPCDPFVTLHELAVAARLKGDAVGSLQRLVDKCPATAERLPPAKRGTAVAARGSCPAPPLASCARRRPADRREARHCRPRAPT